MVGNSLHKQKIGIATWIGLAPFWGTIFLFTYENEYASELTSNDKVKARQLHTTKRFIDKLCTLNDEDAFNDVYKDIYTSELHPATHATFLDITVKGRVVVYKLFDKLNVFPFLWFTCLALIVTFPNQYVILLLLVNVIE